MLTITSYDNRKTFKLTIHDWDTLSGFLGKIPGPNGYCGLNCGNLETKK